MSHNMGREREQTMFYFNVMEWEIRSKRWEMGESTVRVGQVEMVKEKNPEKVCKAERAGYIYIYGNVRGRNTLSGEGEEAGSGKITEASECHVEKCGHYSTAHGKR